MKVYQNSKYNLLDKQYKYLKLDYKFNNYQNKLDVQYIQCHLNLNKFIMHIRDI